MGWAAQRGARRVAATAAVGGAPRWWAISRGQSIGALHRPFHTGSRFSKNAVTPSTMSSVESASVSCARR